MYSYLISPFHDGHKSGANMKNAVVTEAYVSGATKMEPGNVEGAGESPAHGTLFQTPDVGSYSYAPLLGCSSCTRNVFFSAKAPRSCRAQAAQTRVHSG